MSNGKGNTDDGDETTDEIVNEIDKLDIQNEDNEEEIEELDNVDGPQDLSEKQPQSKRYFMKFINNLN